MDIGAIICLALSIGWVADRLWGDPHQLPHLIVGFGHTIAWYEKRANQGSHRLAKGALMALSLIAGSFLLCLGLTVGLRSLSPWGEAAAVAIIVFYCLAGRTLEREVEAVFSAVETSLEQGRKQVGRIVGRQTDHLSAQEVRLAALETLAENLSDGVVAPLFWFALLGAPGIVMYKMANTLDSMVGYRNTRYYLFGRYAARIDDALNYIPARLTAILMILAAGKIKHVRMVWQQGRNHLSPNAGYPEAALAAILKCRFGGAHYYHGTLVEKPYIGIAERPVTTEDMRRGIRINQRVGRIALLLSLALTYNTQQLWNIP